MSQRISIEVSDELFAKIVDSLELEPDTSKTIVQREFAKSLYAEHGVERPLSERELAAIEAKKAKLAELKAELEAAGVELD